MNLSSIQLFFLRNERIKNCIFTLGILGTQNFSHLIVANN